MRTPDEVKPVIEVLLQKRQDLRLQLAEVLCLKCLVWRAFGELAANAQQQSLDIQQYVRE